MNDSNHVHKWVDTDEIYYTTPLVRKQECECGETNYVDVPDSGIPRVKLTDEEFKQHILSKIKVKKSKFYE